jgi:protein-tyrosine phosphatase
MKYAVLFFILGLSFIVLAAELGGPGWLLVWPAVSFLAVGLAYAGLGPRVFGKRPDGTRAWWALGLLLPYLALSWFVWNVLRLLSKEACWHEVAPGIWLGRRALAHELPADVTLVVDLTAEFRAPRYMVPGRTYLCVPTLDASVPDEKTFRALIDRIVTWPGNVYIHCALGRGRSATVAAAVLMARGLAHDPWQAEELLRRARPGVRLLKSQRALLARLAQPPESR